MKTSYCINRIYKRGRLSNESYETKKTAQINKEKSEKIYSFKVTTR